MSTNIVFKILCIHFVCEALMLKQTCHLLSKVKYIDSSLTNINDSNLILFLVKPNALILTATMNDIISANRFGESLFWYLVIFCYTFILFESTLSSQVPLLHYHYYYSYHFVPLSYTEEKWEFQRRKLALRHKVKAEMENVIFPSWRWTAKSFLQKKGLKPVT